MPLDRPSIEREDFPVTRRGYEREAVDAHLRAVADRFEAEWPDTLASTTGDQVKSIISAAESTATALRRDAEKQATARVQEASHDAKQTRREATQQAKQYVKKAREASASMLGRLEALEVELDSLMGGVRSHTERLGDELAELERGLDALIAASDTWTAGEDLGSETADAGLDQQENARLIALDMALDGATRQDTDRHLAENFRLEDREGLIDDVYAEVERASA